MSAVPEKFDDIKRFAEEQYRSYGEVSCPYLDQKVIFNAKGLEHLKFKGRRRARPHSDQYVRLLILRYAPEVIKLSRTVQGVSRKKSFEARRSNHRNESILTEVTYFEFIAVIEERARVRIVVKQVGDSQPYFWSIIPFWKKQADTGRKQMHYGNPEED